MASNTRTRKSTRNTTRNTKGNTSKNTKKNTTNNTTKNSARKNNTRKNSASKKNTGKQKERMTESGIIQDEIILVIALVVSLLLFLSNINLGGKAGNAVSGVLFGIMGLEAYVLPFVLFFGTAFHISNLGNPVAGRKLMSAIVFMVVLTGLLQLVTTGYESSTKLYKYFTMSWESRSGGGILGGILVKILCGLFDTVATYIILIAIMIICIIVITGKAIFTLLAKKSKRTIEQRKEYLRIKQEQKALEEEASPQRRAPKTYLLDPEVVEAGTSLSEPESETPTLNLDYLFPEEPTTDSNDTNATTPITTFEEELKNKFGQVMKGEQSDASKSLNSGIEGAPLSDTVVEQKMESSSEEPTAVTANNQKQSKNRKTNDSTEVEKLDINQSVEEKTYVFPPKNLLLNPRGKSKGMTDKSLKDIAIKLQQTLESFGVHVTITNVSCGPAVTRYELQPEQGVKVSKITGLADDIKLNLAASDIRIEAPIPGKAAVGIEVPNKENTMVTLREMLDSQEFVSHPSDIAFAVGKDIGGKTIVTDIGKMPHLLIAGATGSGKSVCINTLIMSLIYKSSPSDVRLIMIDPKVVELNAYNGIPHLLIPVVTDPKKASAALNWAVAEMTERYKKFADTGVRDLKGYNEKMAEVAHLNDENYQKLPQIVIIIDELADLMMVAPGEVEDAICRLAQMARAAGLHLIIATQRPSVNVITGLIKANIPSRIAFAVSSAIDSRTILDGSGAEKLLGRGDMLFFPSGYPKPVRIQGAFISDKEVAAVVDFLKENNNGTTYSEEVKEKIANVTTTDSAAGGNADRDDYFIEAGKFIIEKDKASIGMLQRVYRIGFNRAARIMDQLADVGVVGPEEGTKPRKVLMSLEQFEAYLEENG